MWKHDIEVQPKTWKKESQTNKHTNTQEYLIICVPVLKAVNWIYEMNKTSNYLTSWGTGFAFW